MSILNDAFDNLTPLFSSETQEKTIVEESIDEPLYIEHSSMSGVEERPLFKRTQSMRMSSILTDAIIEEETGEFEVKNFIPFMARITGHIGVFSGEEINVRWYYGWEEMRLDGSTFNHSSIVSKTGAIGGEAGNSETRAINIMEWGNNLSCVAPGVCIDGCDYPEEWNLQPIGGSTCSVTPVVIMYKVRQNDTGSFRYLFQAENDHDGSCLV